MLFHGNDVAAALGYSNTNKAIRNHCKGRPFWAPLETAGGTQKTRFITEPDVYRLITHSKLPNAQRFEAWVFEEVLPSIRRTGGYVAAKPDESPEEIMARAVLVAQETIERQKRQLDEMKPKAVFADAVATSRTSILIGDLAKILKQNGVGYGAAPPFRVDAPARLPDEGQRKLAQHADAAQHGTRLVRDQGNVHHPQRRPHNRAEDPKGDGQGPAVLHQSLSERSSVRAAPAGDKL